MPCPEKSPKAAWANIGEVNSDDKILEPGVIPPLSERLGVRFRGVWELLLFPRNAWQKDAKGMFCISMVLKSKSELLACRHS